MAPADPLMARLQDPRGQAPAIFASLNPDSPSADEICSRSRAAVTIERPCLLQGQESD